MVGMNMPRIYIFFLEPFISQQRAKSSVAIVQSISPDFSYVNSHIELNWMKLPVAPNTSKDY